MPTLEWIGKKAVENHHRQVPFHLLKDVEDLSVGEAGSGNLLVEGDNLTALKALLPYYGGQVKCIYIDPPYNTGNEKWVYNDNVNSAEIRKWLGKVVGKEGEDLTRHEKWLCMMYPRLNLLKRFMTEDGVIFISIDDTELQNLLLICDEIFKYRIAIFTWQRKKKGSNLSKEFRKITEYVVAYKINNKKIELFGVPAYAEKEVPLLNRANNISEITFPANTIQAGGGIKDGKISAGIFGKGELKVELKNDVDVKDGVFANSFSLIGRFRWSQDTVNDEINNGSIFTISKTFRINIARYNQDTKFKAPSSLLTPDDGIGTNEDATEELRAFFAEVEKLPFEFPKPVSLVQHLIRSATKEQKNAIIMDSFVGSGTTGHSIFELNRKDGGTRKAILVEIDPNICRNVTAVRLRRLCEGYKRADGTDTDGIGGGFRYCTLGEPLFDERGNIRNVVRFAELARHVYFTETGEPLSKQARSNSPLLGACRGTAVYLLYNGILKDKAPDGGNVLTTNILAKLPKHKGPRVIYGTACRIGAERLRKDGITFKQLPYKLKVE